MTTKTKRSKATERTESPTARLRRATKGHIAATRGLAQRYERLLVAKRTLVLTARTVIAAITELPDELRNTQAVQKTLDSAVLDIIHFDHPN